MHRILLSIVQFIVNCIWGGGSSLWAQGILHATSHNLIPLLWTFISSIHPLNFPCVSLKFNQMLEVNEVWEYIWRIKKYSLLSLNLMQSEQLYTRTVYSTRTGVLKMPYNWTKVEQIAIENGHFTVWNVWTEHAEKEQIDVTLMIIECSTECTTLLVKLLVGLADAEAYSYVINQWYCKWN